MKVESRAKFELVLLTPSSAPSSTTIKSGRIIFKLTSIGAEQTLLQAHVDGSNWTQIKLFATNELGFEVVDSGSETLCCYSFS